MKKEAELSFPSQDTIAENAGISRRTVYNSIQKWKDLGFISYKEHNGKTYYTLETIPEHFLTKYGAEMLSDDKRKKLEALQDNASQKAKNAETKRKLKREQKKEKIQAKSSQSLFEPTVKQTKNEKTKTDPVVKSVLDRYQELFDREFNKGVLNHEKRIKVKFTGKELHGSEKAIAEAHAVINDYSHLFMNQESHNRKLLQTLLDDKKLKVDILYDGSLIWSYDRLVRDLKKILNSNDMNQMTNYLYKFLNLTTGSIAHYNKQGWIYEYPTVYDLAQYFRKNEYGSNIVKYQPVWKTDAIRIANEFLSLTDHLI